MDYKDCTGQTFDSHHVYVEYHRITPNIKDKDTLQRWRQLWDGRPCWWCKKSTSGYLASDDHGELHHIAPGHDLTYSFSWLCKKCHAGCATDAGALGHLLWLKWSYDPKNTAWIPLAIKLHKPLPDLQEKKP